MRPGRFWLASAAVAISLGVAAAPVVWHHLGEVPVPAPLLGAEAAPALPAPAPVADVSAVLAFAPFGNAALAAEPAAEAVPVTQLGLALVGLTLANPAKRSRAIISGGDVPVASYAVGQSITSGVTLTEVHADHVILLVSGSPELLSFAKNSGEAGAVPQVFVPIAASGPPDPTNPDAVLAYYRAEILQDPQAVLARLGLQATPDGYLIGDAADADVRRAGFQPGDLVTRVNGRAVGDVAQDQTYIDDIAASGRATLEVQRAGQIITMTFPLR